jgi:hypothetical protein
MAHVQKCLLILLLLFVLPLFSQKIALRT